MVRRFPVILFQLVHANKKKTIQHKCGIFRFQFYILHAITLADDDQFEPKSHKEILPDFVIRFIIPLKLTKLKM